MIITKRYKSMIFLAVAVCTMVVWGSSEAVAGHPHWGHHIAPHQVHQVHWNHWGYSYAYGPQPYYVVTPRRFHAGFHPGFISAPRRTFTIQSTNRSTRDPFWGARNPFDSPSR